VTASGSYYGNLVGTLSVTAHNGVATFSNLAWNTSPTTNLTITLNSTGLASATTSAMSVVQSSASQLVISSYASNQQVGKTFSFSVSVDDPFNNLDKLFNGPVTVALGSNAAGATLGGTVTVNAVNGTATFSDLTVS